MSHDYIGHNIMDVYKTLLCIKGHKRFCIRISLGWTVAKREVSVYAAFNIS